MNGRRHESETGMEVRLRSAAERERALNVCESQFEPREQRQVERKDEVDNALTKAAPRDGIAGARDVAAAKRDRAANLRTWLRGGGGRAEAEARRKALDDRLHSTGDRALSAIDRAVLADIDEPGGQPILG